MGWKLTLGIAAGVGLAIAAAATIFQKQISNAAFTTGQTFGQIPVRLAEGFAEPFGELSNYLSNLFNTSNSNIGGAPTPTPPIGIAPPSAYVPPYTNPPAGATPPKQGGNDNGGNSGSSSGGSPPLFPGYTGQPDNSGPNIFSPPGSTVVVTTPMGATPPKPTTTPAATPPPAPKVGAITINKETATNYTKFLQQVTNAAGSVGQSVVSAANQAWQQIQNGNQYIVIPGLPVISVPGLIPAFAAPPTTPPGTISQSNLKILQLGNAAAKPVVTSPLTTNPAAAYSTGKITVPGSGTVKTGLESYSGKGVNVQDILSKLNNSA